MNHKYKTMIGIYKITSPSGRIYIGQSKDIKRRFTCYKHGGGQGQIILINSFKKYGIKNHIFETIEECKIEELNIRERYYQDYYNVLNGGLNCVLTETDVLPRIDSKETTIKRKLSHIGKKVSEESKIKQSNTMKEKYKYETHHRLGKQNSIETRLKLKEIHKTPKIFWKKVINTETGEIFDSITLAAKHYGMFRQTLNRKLIGTRPNNTNLKLYEE